MDNYVKTRIWPHTLEELEKAARKANIPKTEMIDKWRRAYEQMEWQKTGEHQLLVDLASKNAESIVQLKKTIEFNTKSNQAVIDKLLETQEIVIKGGKKR